LPNQPPQNLTVATTGASGALFLKNLLLTVEHDERIATVNFIASDSALRVIAEELELKGRSKLVGQLLGKASRKIKEQSNANIGANVASGSYPADAMIVIPCSVGTLARMTSRGWPQAVFDAMRCARYDWSSRTSGVESRGPTRE